MLFGYQLFVKCTVGEDSFLFFKMLLLPTGAVFSLTEDFQFLEVPFINC